MDFQLRIVNGGDINRVVPIFGLRMVQAIRHGEVGNGNGCRDGSRSWSRVGVEGEVGIGLESDLETEVFIIVVLEDNGVGLADFQVVQKELHAAPADAVTWIAVFEHGSGNVVFLHVDFL